MHIGKIKKGWQELYEEVIQTGKCVYCGACGAFCANIKFDPDKEIPLEDGSCEDMNTCRDGYGLCYNLCPKTEVESIPISLLDKWVFAQDNDQILGHILDINTVKLTEKAREIIPAKAGVISSLLWTAMDEGLIDSSTTVVWLFLLFLTFLKRKNSCRKLLKTINCNSSCVRSLFLPHLLRRLTEPLKSRLRECMPLSGKYTNPSWLVS